MQDSKLRGSTSRGSAIGVALVALVVLAIGWAPSAFGQATVNPSCAAAAINFQDACQKTIDVFTYVSPELGTAIAGGNAILGEGGTLGGLGHFSVGFQGNIAAATVPKANNITLSTTGAVADTFKTSGADIPMATFSAAVGLFKGVSLGLGQVGGVDLLVSALYVPSYSTNGVSVSPNHNLSLGFGGRLGLFKGAGFLPGVSFTLVERDLPQTTIKATPTTDTLIVQGLKVNTTSWRLVANENIVFVGLAAGFGQDHYSSSTGVGAVVGGVSSGSTPLASPSMSVTRNNYFGDLSLNMGPLRIILEYGQVSGGTLLTYNQFKPTAAGAAVSYGSLGLRVKI
jgi:hypothetical protein